LTTQTASSGDSHSTTTKRRVLNERSFVTLQRAWMDVRCPACRDTGHVALYPIQDKMGLLAWSLARIPSDKIPWCNHCEAGPRERAKYEDAVGGYRQSDLLRNFEQAQVPERFHGLGLDTIQMMHRKGKEMALAAAAMFLDLGYAIPEMVCEYDKSIQAHGKNRRDGLAFIGKPGVGKTGILSVVFQEMVQQGTQGLWVELYDFFASIQGQYGKDGGLAHERMEAAQKVELLFLDDCGDPDRRDTNRDLLPETDDKRRILWQVLDHRHGKHLPTLITSNLDRSGLETQWGTRLAARLWELCWVVPVGGVDLRGI